MPLTEQERVQLKLKEKEEEKKLLSKQKAQSFKLPSKVEPKKVEPTKETSVKDTKANRTAEYNKAVDKLESFLERGLISKELFEERFRQLGKNLKDGGEI
jgi:predicted RNA-binding protein Jag